ncbi:MAG: hypothetical protein E7H69_18895 [Clostridioides difficile]|nr:hypothetical protein [Clostridioides difficile]
MTGPAALQFGDRRGIRNLLSGCLDVYTPMRSNANNTTTRWAA